MSTSPPSLDRTPPRVPTAGQHRVWRFFESHLQSLSIALMIMTLVAAILYPYVVITVPSGHIGVLWKKFANWNGVGGGTVMDSRKLREEGIHFIWPWDKLFIYDLRLQSSAVTYNAISKDGVSLTASVNFRFQLKRDFIPRLHRWVGPDYMQLLVRPKIGSLTREVISLFDAPDVYSSSRKVIEECIRIKALAESRQGGADPEGLLVPAECKQKDAAPARAPAVVAEPQQCAEEADSVLGESKLREQCVVTLDDALDLYDTLVLGIELPPPVVAAINRKTEQLYLSQEYVFRIAREKQESERKQIEAFGISQFQRIVGQGISDSYLRWRGIEATLQLAQSPNSKVVIIGGGKDGVPIILGNVDAPPAPASTSAPASTAAPGSTSTPESTSAPGSTPAPASTPATEGKPPPSGPATPEKPPAPGPAPAPDKSSDAETATPSAAKPEKPSSVFPITFDEVRTWLSRKIAPTKKAETASQPSEAAAAAKAN